MSPESQASRLEPLHLLAVAGAGASMSLTVGPISDIDSYWHVVAGRQLLAGVPMDQVGGSWLADGLPGPWASSQWLSEAAMALAVGYGGWNALVIGKELLIVAAMLASAVATMYRVPARIGAPVFVLTALAIAAASQERPQTVSFIFLPLVGLAAARIASRHKRPPWWVVSLLSILWANLHGLWILAPAAFGLMFVLTALSDRGWRRQRPRDALLLLVCSLAGLLNPLGLESLTLPLTFQGATPLIGEWKPAVPWMLPYVGFDLLVLLTFVAWARRRSPVTVVEVGWVLFWVTFAMMAHRNIWVAALLVAPFTVLAASRAWPTGPACTSARERRWLARTCLVLAVAFVTWTGVRTLGGDPLAQAHPRKIAEHLGTSVTPLRVLNGYDASGVLIAFSEGKSLLAIDGRADLWGNERITRSVNAERLGPGWRQTVTDFDPDALVITAGSALDELLRTSQTAWTRVLTDDTYVLWSRDRRSLHPLFPPEQSQS